MSFFQTLDQFLVGRITFPAVNYFLNRRNILGRYRKSLLSERYSKEVLQELQFQRLSAVLRHAYRWNSFYTKRFMEIGLVPEDIKSLEDFRRIPPLTRQEVIDHRLDLVDFRYRDSVPDADHLEQEAGLPISFAKFRQRRLIRMTSSGSTGNPTVFYEDGSTTALNWVHELRLKHWFGLHPGVKEARFSALSTEYWGQSERPSAREWLWNQMILPGYFLSDREYQHSLRKIRKFKPRVLWGPTHALTGLAHYVQRQDEDITRCRPDLLISRAAPLYAHEKSLLTEVFGCSVTNIYGTREVGHVAMNCPHGSIHVNSENYLVEIEGSGLNERRAGPGKILITPLFETPMPFIRYRIGDVVEMGAGNCPCGRSSPVISKILGRLGDVFKTRDGRLIDPNFWCIAFEAGRLSRDIERFQVVYRRNDCICFRIVPRRSYSADTEAEFRNFVGKNFMSAMQVEFEYVPEIRPQPSGKFLFVVNEIEHQEEQPAHV